MPQHVHVWRQLTASGPPQIDETGAEFVTALITCRCGVDREVDTYTGKRLPKEKANARPKPARDSKSSEVRPAPKAVPRRGGSELGEGDQSDDRQGVKRRRRRPAS